MIGWSWAAGLPYSFLQLGMTVSSTLRFEEAFKPHRLLVAKYGKFWAKIKADNFFFTGFKRKVKKVLLKLFAIHLNHVRAIQETFAAAFI